MADSVWSCKREFGSACQGLPLDNEREGKRYCVLHFPGEKDSTCFRQAISDKLEVGDFNFSGAYFPNKVGAQFKSTSFKTRADFHRATFEENADFSKASFKENADFTGAKFKGRGAVFNRATFKGNADFTRATFKGVATFYHTTFENLVTFSRATFEGLADFDHTNFNDQARFSGPKAFNRIEGVNFRDTRIDKPELLSMHEIQLRPSWFVEVNAQEFDFTKVEWYGMPGGPASSIEEEIAALERRHIESAHDVLAQACRRLSANMEENREYPLANEFHYWSMDVARKRNWSCFKDTWRTHIKTWRDLLERESWPAIARHFSLITTLYWALNGYGVRAARAFWILVAIWAAFTTLYVLVDPSEFSDFGQGIGYRWQAAVYSLLALARLNPQPSPDEPGLFQFLVGLEGILGPLQIALLALAIRRQVMR